MVRQCDAMHRSNAFDGEGQGGCVDAMCLSSVPCLRADVLPPTAAPPLARMEFDYHVRRYHHKNLTPPRKKMLPKMYQVYKGSAWAPAFSGAHASGRAGQHFGNLRVCSCPIWHALNFKVMPIV